MFISYHTVKWKACIFTGIRCRAFAGRYSGCLSAPEATSNVRRQAYRCLCRIPGGTVDEISWIWDILTEVQLIISLGLTHTYRTQFGFFLINGWNVSTIAGRSDLSAYKLTTRVAQRADAFATAPRHIKRLSRCPN